MNAEPTRFSSENTWTISSHQAKQSNVDGEEMRGPQKEQLT